MVYCLDNAGRPGRSRGQASAFQYAWMSSLTARAPNTSVILEQVRAQVAQATKQIGCRLA